MNVITVAIHHCPYFGGFQVCPWSLCMMSGVVCVWCNNTRFFFVLTRQRPAAQSDQTDW